MTTFDVRKMYERFFRIHGAPAGSDRPWQYRRRETSLRLAGCLVLEQIVNERTPKRILDLGSGLTTHLLRNLAFPLQATVVTTDTDRKWLNKTIDELHRDGWHSDSCYTQDEFEQHTWPPFDLISVDCGNLTYRATLAPKLAEWCAPGGVLVLDDWHMEPYPQVMGDALRALGFDVTPRADSIDEAGGFLATAERV